MKKQELVISDAPELMEVEASRADQIKAKEKESNEEIRRLNNEEIRRLNNEEIPKNDKKYVYRPFELKGSNIPSIEIRQEKYDLLCSVVRNVSNVQHIFDGEMKTDDEKINAAFRDLFEALDKLDWYGVTYDYIKRKIL